MTDDKNTNSIIVNIDQELEAIVPNFLEKRVNELPKMKDFLKNSDYASLQALGHRLKGNGGGYGFDELSRIGGDIETAAKQNDSAILQDRISELEFYLSHVTVKFDVIR